MHQAYTPDLPSSTSSTAITLFDGLVQNGGDAAILYCFVFLYFVFAGPGPWSVDAMRGRTGAYLAVIEPGRISAGDEIRVLEVPAHGVTVPQSFRALMGDRDLAGQILASGAGSEMLRAELEGRQ